MLSQTTGIRSIDVNKRRAPNANDFQTMIRDIETAQMLHPMYGQWTSVDATVQLATNLVYSTTMLPRATCASRTKNQQYTMNWLNRVEVAIRNAMQKLLNLVKQPGEVGATQIFTISRLQDFSGFPPHARVTGEYLRDGLLRLPGVLAALVCRYMLTCRMVIDNADGETMCCLKLS
jgi:hypothetical protein